jgi:hypothetical protein
VINRGIEPAGQNEGIDAIKIAETPDESELLTPVRKYFPELAAQSITAGRKVRRAET